MKILDWISDHLFVIVIIAGAIGQLIKAVRGKQADDDPAAPAEQSREFQFDDPELAERTRRIRDDIRRKIAERQRGGQPDEPPPLMREEPPVRPAAYEEAPPPVVREVTWERSEPLRPFEPARATTRLESQRAAEILEEQATMAERLREAETMKIAAKRRAAFEALSVSETIRQREKTRGALLDDLHSPDALRRAFVLREVLGPPVGLR